LGLCATYYMLKRQDEEYCGGLCKAVLERTATPVAPEEQAGGANALPSYIIACPENRSSI